MKKSSWTMSDTYEELGSLENEPSREGRVLAGHLLLTHCITYFMATDPWKRMDSNQNGPGHKTQQI